MGFYGSLVTEGFFNKSLNKEKVKLNEQIIDVCKKLINDAYNKFNISKGFHEYGIQKSFISGKKNEITVIYGNFNMVDYDIKLYNEAKDYLSNQCKSKLSKFGSVNIDNISENRKNNYFECTINISQ